MNIECLGEKITKEIRLNRAIRTQFNSLFLKTQQNLVLLEDWNCQELKKGNFLEELFGEVEKVKNSLGKKDVNVGQVSALLKQIEVEESYLMDHLGRIRARCFLNMLALKYAEKKEKEQQAKDLEWKTKLKYSLLTIFILTILCTLLCIF